MTSGNKLEILLIHQAGYVVCAVLLVFGYVGGMIGVFLLLGVQKLTRKKEKALKEANVRLTQFHKHIYFGAWLMYFFMVAAVLLLFCILESSARTWTIAGFVFAVLLVLVYAGAQSIYGPNSKV